MATLAVGITLCLITALISVFHTREQQNELHDVSALLVSQLLEQKHQATFNYTGMYYYYSSSSSSSSSSITFLAHFCSLQAA